MKVQIFMVIATLGFYRTVCAFGQPVPIPSAPSTGQNFLGNPEPLGKMVCPSVSTPVLSLTCSNSSSTLMVFRGAFGFCYGYVYKGRLGYGVASNDPNRPKGLVDRINNQVKLVTANNDLIDLSSAPNNQLVLRLGSHEDRLVCQ